MIFKTEKNVICPVDTLLMMREKIQNFDEIIFKNAEKQVYFGIEILKSGL